MRLDRSRTCKKKDADETYNSYQKDIWKAIPKERMERNVGETIGFSSSSSSDRLTEEQENEIAENIYD
nr:MAG TPA_asm: hypothetical protein [Caudoviricetes sp.]